MSRPPTPSTPSSYLWFKREGEREDKIEGGLERRREGKGAKDKRKKERGREVERENK